MLLNKIRNKELVREFSNISPNKNSNGDLIESKLVKAKDGNNYVIIHIQFSNEDKTLSHRGRYEIQNNKCQKIGELKYILFENSNPAYMKLCDINFYRKYRNIGLGSIVINLFELRAESYGAHHITGDLSFVDSETPADEKLRNTFYLKRGYQIINSDKIYKKLQ